MTKRWMRAGLSKSSFRESKMPQTQECNVLPEREQRGHENVPSAATLTMPTDVGVACAVTPTVVTDVSRPGLPLLSLRGSYWTTFWAHLAKANEFEEPVPIASPHCTTSISQQHPPGRSGNNTTYASLNLHHRKHPSDCSSLDDVEIRKMQSEPGVFTIISLMCCYDTRLTGSDKEVRIHKSIKWLTICSVLAEALDRRFAKHTGQAWHHRHVPSLRVLAMHATAFSPVLINTVLKATKKQMCSDGQLSAANLTCDRRILGKLVFDRADEQIEKLCEHFDKITGSSPPADLVKKGKFEDIAWVKRVHFCDKIPRRRREKTPILPTQWVSSRQRRPRSTKRPMQELNAKTKDMLLANMNFALQCRFGRRRMFS